MAHAGRKQWVVAQGVGGRSQSDANKNKEAETRAGEQMRDWTGGIQSPSPVLGGDLEPAAHVPALLLLLLSWLPRVHLSSCADPSAQALDRHTTALSVPSKLLEHLDRQRRRRLLARDVVPRHRVARQRLEGRGRAEGGGVSVALAFGGGKRECSRIGVAICAGAGDFCASQTLRTRSGPMLACRLRHLSHPRDSRDWSKCQPPNALYPRPYNACILGYGCEVLLLPLLRGDDTLTLCLRAGPSQERR